MILPKTRAVDPDPQPFFLMDQLHGLFYVWAIFFFSTTASSSSGTGNFLRFLKLDPDPHRESSWIPIRIGKNSWIRIRKKEMRIHSPAQK